MAERDDSKILGNFRYLVPYENIGEIIDDVDLEPNSFCLLVSNGMFELIAVADYPMSATNWKMQNGAFASLLPVAGEFSFDYTNHTPVPVPLGGIEQGETFEAVPIKTMFDKLLYPASAANFKVYTNLSSTSFLVGEVVLLTEVELKEIICPGIHGIRLQVGEWTTEVEVSDDTTEYKFLINKEIVEDTTIIVSVMGDRVNSRTINVTFGFPWFWGVVDVTFIPSSGNIQRLNRESVGIESNILDIEVICARDCVFVAVPEQIDIIKVLDEAGINNIDNFSIGTATLYFGTEAKRYKTYISNQTSVKNYELRVIGEVV